VGERDSGGAGDGGSASAVSVIVVAYNGRRHLEHCLPALAGTAGVAFDTTVVDNASADGTAAWVRECYPGVRVLALERNLGFGEANRRGVAATGAPLVAFLNSDTVVDPGWLAELVKALSGDPAIGAACSTLRLLDRPDLLNARGGGMTRLGYGFDRDYLHPAAPSPLDPEPPQREVLFPTAAAMLMRRRDFLDLGGFDPAMFMYHEDVDLGWRIWLSGKRVVVCRDSVVLHAHGGSVPADRGRRWKDRLGAQHVLRSVLKNRARAGLPAALLDLARLWARNAAVRHALGALSWNLLHLPGTLRERRRVQRARRLGDLDLAGLGLLSRCETPPAPPQRPRIGPGRAAPDLIPSDLLRPGYHSALGRLGAGWHARERDRLGWLRRTCGHARCTLRVAPEARGTLVVAAGFTGPEAAAGEVLVSCNERAASASLAPGEWGEITLPAVADGRGVLEVTIASHGPASGDPACAAGCAVRTVRFVPETRPPAPAYRTVSVIVPTFNRWPILAETLAALAQQTCRDVEVIVVDDGSTDGTWERLTAWSRDNARRVRLVPLRQENLKPGRARNLGLRHATGDLVVFIGDDTVPGSELVAEHLAAHNAAGETIAVLGFTDWHRERVRVTPFLELVNRDGQQFSYGHFAAGEDVFFTCLYTSNVSVPRRVLGEDPFHPAFTFVDWEDVELGYRLSLRGLRIVYHPAAAARHAHPMTMASFYRRQEHVGRTLDVLLALHPDLAGDDAMPPAAPPPWLRLARHPVRALLPLLSIWDRLGVPLPRRVYSLVLLTAYFSGRAQGFVGGHPEGAPVAAAEAGS
jgi:GT2 family glycosyltransferase